MRLSDIFKPAWQSKNREKAIRAVKKMTDQTMLIQIAINAEDVCVRAEAVKKITDQTVLIEVAKKDMSDYVRHTAVEKLTDQTILFDIAKNDEYFEVRRTAIKKLTDQTSLADIAKNADGQLDRDQAIKQLTDQTSLTDVAKNGEYGDVRIDATKKLIDQALAQEIYADIALNDEDFSMRISAIEQLTDQNVLLKITKSTSEKDYQKATGSSGGGEPWNTTTYEYIESLPKHAAQRLTDLELLIDVIKNVKDDGVRIEAIRNENMTDQSVMADIAKNDGNHTMRWEAIQKLTDQVLLSDVAINAKEQDERRRAVEKLTDQVQLSNVAINAKDPLVCMMAFQTLENFHHPSQTTYTEIARKATDDWVREAAAKKLTNQNEDISFSVAAFQPAVTVPGFSKEDALIILEKYLADNKPQNMSSDETEMLKPLFLNLLMYFRNNAYLYAQTGKGFGDACDSCMRDITVNDFYFAGNYAKCENCALRSIVSTLDWNYYLEHVVQGIGHVPNSIVLQAHSIQDKIIKRREALSRH